MMKTYQKLVAGGLVVALSAGATFMYAGNRVEAGVGRETEVGISSGSKFIVTKTAGVLSTEKKEVVYVFAGADGKEDKIMALTKISHHKIKSPVLGMGYIYLSC